MTTQSSTTPDHARPLPASATDHACDVLGMVGHELRSPLTSMLSWVQVLQLMPASADLRDEALQALLRSIHEQSRLIDEFQEVARLLRGQAEARLGGIDLASAFQSAHRLLHEALPPSSRRIELLIANDAGPLFVQADAVRLGRVLWRALAYARSYAGEAQPMRVVLEAANDLACFDLVATIKPNVPMEENRGGPTLQPWPLFRDYGLTTTGLFLESMGGTLEVARAADGSGVRLLGSLPRAERVGRTEGPATAD